MTLAVDLELAPDTTSGADVVVIGSGAGGAPTAALLAEAGLDVLVIEEGRFVPQGDVVPFSLDQMTQQYRSGGVTVALGRPAVAYTEACCVGGGTEVNSGLYRRPPEELLDRWRSEHRIEDFATDELYAIGDEIEAELSVGMSPETPIAPSELLHDGARALGWASAEAPRWMRYDSQPPRRQSMTETYLPRASAAGARVLAGHRVERIVRDGARAVGVLVRPTRSAPGEPDGPARLVRCGAVFVCGGAIQTPATLLRSGWSHRVGHGLAVHPTVKLAARFAGEINVPDDVPVHQVKEFAPDLSFGGSASSPGLIALALSDHWDAFRPAIESWREIAVYYAAITSEGRGRVRIVPGMRDPLVTYRLTSRDRALLGSGLTRLALAMLAAGATEVYPSFRNAPVIRSRRALHHLASGFRATAASVMTVHLCGSVPLGGDSSRSAVDSFGRVWGTENVFVNDASLLPDAPGVNPQATVMTVAIRNARRFLDQRKGSPA